MGLPKYYEMHKPFLEYLKDGKLHTLKELKQFISKYFNLTEEELLEKKLLEEVNEYLEDKNLEEIADVMEVLFGLANELGYSEEDLINKRNEKLEKRGGFKEGIVLKVVK